VRGTVILEAWQMEREFKRDQGTDLAFSTAGKNSVATG
jgi:hypothetical protein